MKSLFHPYLRFCQQLRQKRLLRQLPKSRHYTYDFSTNDYLGLSQHPKLIAAAQHSATQMGVGAKASRLILSEQQPLKDLEQSIAKTKHSQSALVFATGFQANISVLSALLDPRTLGVEPLVFADKLNHASMHTACQLVGVKQIRYRHLDLDHLAYLLNKTKDSKQPRYILTESVFGMDGDVVDMQRLIALAKQYQAILYVDEAHATGILGKSGYGLTEDYGSDVDISMGTFSKALGTSGAYVACSSLLKRYFINSAKGLIYSTAPAPINIATMQAAWDLMPQLRHEVQSLLEKAKQLRQQFSALGYQITDAVTHIIPVIVKEPQHALEIQQFLADRNIRVAAIRPPTVPQNQSRIRIALSLAHQQDAIEALKQGFADYSLMRQINVT